MFDFIKSNKKVFGLLFLGLFLIVLIFIVILTAGSRVEVGQDDDSVLPDTSAEREFDTNEPFIFGPTDSERWVTDSSSGGIAPEFRALTKEPVAGAVVFNRFRDGSLTPSVRYVSLGNGNIYETSVSTVSSPNKVSDKVVSNVGDVVWSNVGSEVVLRYYDNSLEYVNSTLGTFMRASSSEDTEVFSGDPLRYDHRQLDIGLRGAVFSPDGSQMFYLVETTTGTEGYVESVQTGTKAKVWDSVFKNLTMSWSGGERILVYTNPSSLGEGVVWLLNPTTGSTDVILSGELALSAKLNRLGDLILYSIQEEKGEVFSLRVLDLNTGEIRVLPVETMSEKCAWGGVESNNIYCAVPRERVAGEYLEQWYMGIEHTDDQIWRIDVLSGNIKMLFDPKEEVAEEFDIVTPLITPAEDYVVFRTRGNNALWSLKLPEVVVPVVEEVVE